jgi:hypothetical protein
VVVLPITQTSTANIGESQLALFLVPTLVAQCNCTLPPILPAILIAVFTPPILVALVGLGLGIAGRKYEWRTLGIILNIIFIAMAISSFIAYTVKLNNMRPPF